MPTDDPDEQFVVTLSPAFARQLRDLVAAAGGGPPEVAMRRVVEGALLAHAVGLEFTVEAMRSSLATSDATNEADLAEAHRIASARVGLRPTPLLRPGLA